ncbi:hypothetical protein I314_04740 [Cryptococcus bacillisporus CA1873]|uniref:Uncharacterized protein n=1 Tax=Cryptococcus bacillisporus CA1873 TaxID=1296111 RepID=A0ABR5B7N4_CRYGA|nr:hypothetical protein I314_04740 [Cryptococcus bacillisporus CA1873]|eukprot:KIR59225.1 hypothetical protein I314_04740 [Cryptococcus gattii CA1873]
MSEAATTHPMEDEPTKPQVESGFVGLLVKSVFEPGANPAVVMAMNVCFVLLILTLFALAFLTQWNKHVLLLLGVTLLLWGSMAWFVLELTRVQNRPDNMPPPIDLDSLEDSPADESKKEK